MKTQVKIKLKFINSYLANGNRYGEANVPMYECAECDAMWTLDNWKGVEEHLDGIDCMNYLDWLFYHENAQPSEEYLENEWKYCPE